MSVRTGFSGAALLLLALSAASAPRATAAGNATSCPSLSTPLDSTVSSWMITLYVPPAALPAFLFPGSPEAAPAEEALNAQLAEWESASLTVDFNASFAAVGYFEYVWLAGAEPNPGKPLGPNDVRLRTMNITGPFFNPERIPESFSAGGGGGGGGVPMGPSLQIYSPGKGLYEEMQSATNGEEGDTLQLSQVLWCDKHSTLISFMSNSTTPIETLTDLLALSPAMEPVLGFVEASDSTADLEAPLEYETEWVRRTYWPTEYEGEPAGWLIANVDFDSLDDAIAGTNPGKAELLLGAHPPASDAPGYLEELQRFAMAVQAALDAVQEEEA